MSNSIFLHNDWPDLFKTAREVAQNVTIAPRTSWFSARRSLERAVMGSHEITHKNKGRI